MPSCLKNAQYLQLFKHISNNVQQISTAVLYYFLQIKALAQLTFSKIVIVWEQAHILGGPGTRK